jgi:integrase
MSGQHLSPAQARDYLGVSRFIFDERIRPQLTEIRHGERTIRFDRIELDAYLADSGGMFNKKKVSDALDHTWDLRWQHAKGATKKNYIRKVVAKELGGEPVTKVDYARLVEWVTDMRNRDLAPATIRARLSCLLFALKEAQKLGWIKQLPAVPELEAAGAKDRWLRDEPDEEALLLTTCGSLPYEQCDVMRAGITFLVDSGARLGEFVKVRSYDLVKSKGTQRTRALFTDRKAADSNGVILTERALAAIEFLLGNRYWMLRVRGATESKKREESAVSWFSHRFILIRNKAGLRDVTTHSLRHTCASRLVQAGVSLYDVQKWLGHKSITQTERYAHLAPGNQDRVVDVLDKRNLPDKVARLPGAKTTQ